MKIIAYYLPQFHNIPENDEWWGDGFTEWTNVKAAKSLFPGHDQPKVPLAGNYYNLLDNDVKRWQANLAREYGIYGFCYYHYWFNGKMLLERPMEQMLADPTIDMPFCISWANEAWTKSWVGDQRETLIVQRYGEEREWREHFEYLLQFFKDPRYIKKNDKPFFVIYRPEIIPCLKEMLSAWNKWSIEEGFSGISFAYQSCTTDFIKGAEDELFDYLIEYQPRIGRQRMTDGEFGRIKKARRRLYSWIETRTGINLLKVDGQLMQKVARTTRQDYGKVWDSIISMQPLSAKSIPGAFKTWDNSPRYGDRAEVYLGATPAKFERYMTLQIEHAKKAYNTDFMMFFAWNEWCEGGYLEPDESDGYAYLEGLRKALISNDEWPTRFETNI